MAEDNADTDCQEKPGKKELEHEMIKRNEVGRPKEERKAKVESGRDDKRMQFSYEHTLQISHEDTAEKNVARSERDPRLVARVHYGGLVHKETGQKVDIVANHFEDEQTVLHLPVDQANRKLSKRLDRAGFQISFTTRVRSLLTAVHQSEMPFFLATAWSRMSKEFPMDDIIGFAETEHFANFYHRIIPELRGFGEFYETVDECGGLGKYL